MSGGELDCVAGVQRLAEHGIPHIIIQHCYESEGDELDDGTIPDTVSLASGLANRLDGAEHRTVLSSAAVDHQADIPKPIQNELDRRVKEFFNSTQP